MREIFWTPYLQYRAELRGFDLAKIEEILRYGQERYYDGETDRLVVVGRHDDCLVLIPHEESGEGLTPVTIHPTSRQQIRFRLNNGRYSYEFP
jgi:hypothetical protein